MRQCFAYFKIKFITKIQYRTSALAGILTQLFFGLIFVMVYLAFYESNNTTPPMQINEIVSYLWLGQSFYALTYLYHKDKDIMQMIRNGNISYELCRPGNIFYRWYFRILGDKLASVLLRFLPILILGFLLPSPYNLSLPNSIYSLVGFIITILLSFFLTTGIVTLFHILIFYTIECEGVLSMFKVISELFAGSIVPILFLPKFLQKISMILPFQYIGDVPYRIYTGNIGSQYIIPSILVEIIWIIIVFVLTNLLVKKTLKKVVIQGG